MGKLTLQWRGEIQAISVFTLSRATNCSDIGDDRDVEKKKTYSIRMRFRGSWLA